MKFILTYNQEEPFNLFSIPVPHHQGSRTHKFDTEDEMVRWVIARNQEVGLIVGRYWVVDEADMPKSNVFLNAWEWKDGRCQANRPKAEAIQMERIRRLRNDALERESGSKYRQPPEIEALFTEERRAKLQALRDIPQTFDLSTCEDLENAWPPELA